MQVNFRRDIQHRYAVLASSEMEKPDYKANMIRSNAILGFAECSFEQMDEAYLFYYEIPSGCRSLSDRLEKDAVNAELYRGLLAGLARAFGQIREYLLDAEELLLDPELVFWREETREPLFLYFPAEGKPLEKSCGALSEFLIGRLDHEEKEAVQLGYAFYRGSMGGKISEEFLYRLAQGKAEEEEQKQAEERAEEKTEDIETIEPQPEQMGEKRAFWRIGSEKGKRNGKKERAEKERKPFFRRRKKQEAEKEDDWIFLTENEESKEAMPPEETGRSAYGKLPEPEAGCDMDEGNRQMQEEMIAAPEEAVYETVLLKTADRCSESIRAWLIPQEDFLGENLYLEEDSYLVGKSIAGVQLPLESPVVSRVHARLFWKENTYRLTDLGSRNGTKVNGEWLEPGVNVPLSDGDEIRFADKIFLYYSRERLQKKAAEND